jgi:hypothetical protein
MYSLYYLHGAQRTSSEANSFSASQEIPAFYGTQRFIPTFTSARHLSLSWARPIQSISPDPTSWRTILIYLPIYTQVFQVSCFHQVSPPEPCTHFWFPHTCHMTPPWSDQPNISRRHRHFVHYKYREPFEQPRDVTYTEKHTRCCI